MSTKAIKSILNVLLKNNEQCIANNILQFLNIEICHGCKKTFVEEQHDATCKQCQKCHKYFCDDCYELICCLGCFRNYCYDCHRKNFDCCDGENCTNEYCEECVKDCLCYDVDMGKLLCDNCDQ